MAYRLLQCVIFFCQTFLLLSYVSADCTFPKVKEVTEGMRMIERLKGKRYTMEDMFYKYAIGICVPAQEGDKAAEAAVLQFDKHNTSKEPVIIGRVTAADIMHGGDWVLLEYNKGKSYTTHCGSEERRARIMITCDENAVNEQLFILSEENNRTDTCFYLFEISTDVVCPVKPLITVGLSVGSVILIVLFSVVVLYLILGFSYNRFVLRAKGYEQIPNYSFWKDFGNLQADGCNLICRSKDSQQPRSYKGVGDDQLQVDEERGSGDDHLLPM
ncbi:hypothetical protein CHS0354_011308 [Potamilus streckersoni]|uniref:MRH domain-containing protein n=1 Tax=Potamilus streckersoni TaxID=2493646 RepID=A0AAE0VRH4_9BIVA|nr:hypothetical protein CHS0354_011308 [Potamilus streckersoni]